MPTPTPNSPIPVDFSKLGDDYQILTELHRDGDTPTYLARHNGLSRDVTITVFRTGGDRSYLEAFADDAKVLAEKRNPSIIPVIEGRWLDDQTFAIVRARVRGSTLDQLLSAVGSMPEPRVGATLRQVAAALGWARANGVKHRRVSPQSVVFQQGSGKVLLALEPWPNPSDDIATIRDLATKMTGGAPVDITEYVGLLSGGVITDAITDGETPVPVADSVVPISPVRGETIVVQQRSGMGFNARVLSAFAVLAAVIVLAVVLVHRRGGENVRVTKTSNGVLDSGSGEPAGDVALHSNRLDSIAAAAANAPRDVPPPIIQPQMSPPPVVSPPPQTMPAPTPAEPPVQPPTRPAPAPRAQTTTDTSAPSVAVGSAGSTDACASTIPSDQRRCLTNSIQENDRALNSVYQRLIAALRRQAGVADDDPDPPTVQDLRDSQRRWLEQRDDACHNVGGVPFFGRDRAACYADKSAERVKELQARLDAM